MSERPRSPRGAARKSLALAWLAGLTIAATGCVIAETQEETFWLRPGGKRGDYVIVLRNIQSDGPTPHHQQQDFDGMVRLLQSDDYLLDRVQSGVHVKTRELIVEKGVLVAREVGLFADPGSVGLERQPDSTVRRWIGKDLEVISTNGRLVASRDTVYIRWPKRTREFLVLLKDRRFHTTASLVERYQAWKATQK